MTTPQPENRLATAAQWYGSQGWKILPCHGIVGGRCTCNTKHGDPKNMGKHPVISRWNTEASSDAETISYWWNTYPDSNVAVFCKPSGFFVIDVDPRSGGFESFEKFEQLIDGALPPTVEALTGKYNIGGKEVRGKHLFYQCDPDEELIGNFSKAGLKGLDIKHDGYLLLAPSNHFSGVQYEFVAGKEPWNVSIAEPSAELMNAVRKKNTRSSTIVGEGDWEKVFEDLGTESERVDIQKMLVDGIDEGSRAIDCYKLSCALANKFGVEEDGRLAVESMMIRFNAERIRPPLDINELMTHVKNAIQFVKNNPKESKIEKVFPGMTEWAKKSQEESRKKYNYKESNQESVFLDGKNLKEKDVKPLLGVVSPIFENDELISSLGNVDDNDNDSLANNPNDKNKNRSFSDIGNGRRLVDHFGHEIRYTTGLGWFHWQGDYWKPDKEEIEVKELAKKLSVRIMSESVHYLGDSGSGQDEFMVEQIRKWATQAKSSGKVRSAIDFANTDPRIQVTPEEWDSDPYLLGVNNGVVDLRTGDLLKNRPDLYITRRAPVGYNRGQKNVRWEEFLNFATDGDKELQDWLQRAAGYTITGLRNFDIMFLVYGPAGSGKNTLVEAIVKCLGSGQYSWPMLTDVFAQGDGKSNGSDQYYWAELRGRRMVWIDELPDNERLKENSVKKLTGSSEITGRFPGGNAFTFSSQVKLWISTNHRPVITDDAMWRRIRPIPLLNVPQNPDPELKDYIFDPDGALPAVLSWAVEGAIKLIGSSNRDGLGWCTAVSEAADIYRKNEDRVGLFLEEETNEFEGAKVLIKELYSIYRYWSQDRGEREMAQSTFQRKLIDRNLRIEGSGARAVLYGKALIPRPFSIKEVDYEQGLRVAKL